MDFPNASAQDKFIIMLQERLDKLTDELHDLRENNPMSIHAATKSYQNLKCSDIGCIASAVYIKIITPKEEINNQIITIVTKYQHLKAFTYHSGKLSDYDEDEDEEFIIQMLVCFKHSMVASRIGVEICKNFTFEDLIKVELQPIYDFHDGFENMNADSGLFKYYYYNIVAAKENTRPDMIGERDVDWTYFDGMHINCFFRGNVFGGNDNYINIIRKIKNIDSCVWPHKLQN